MRFALATAGGRDPAGGRVAGLRSAQLAVIGALLVLAAIAWVVTDLRMAGMDAGPGTDPGAFGFYVTTWVVMMAAMMFPSIAPMVLMYRNLQRGRRAQGQRAPAGDDGAVRGGLPRRVGGVGPDRLRGAQSGAGAGRRPVQPGTGPDAGPRRRCCWQPRCTSSRR